MPSDGEPSTCDFCKQAAVFSTLRELVFRQITCKGYIFCKVTIPVATCHKCHFESWDSKAEAIVEAAVKRETGAL
jgi:hypothetical protein